MMPTRLSLHDVGVRFGAYEAVRGVSFDAPGGALIGVIGPNGAGKSSLFRAIIGTVPHRGTITCDGAAAYVPQGDRADRDFPVTALDVALMGRYAERPWWRRLSADDRDAAHAALAATSMDDHAGCSFGELSGGQRQRVMVARAIAQNSRVMLLDEPLTGVDSVSAGVITDTLARLRDSGTTILVATHDLNDAARTCDLLLFLNRDMIAYGTAAETFSPETLQRTYSGAIVILDPTDGSPIGVLDEGSHHDHGHGVDGHDHPHVHRAPA